MENKKLNRSHLLFIALIIMLIMASCGPVVLTSKQNNPPPPWFYPNRVEMVRYVYFPEHHFYYDLSTNNYLYLDGSVWVRRNVLPPRYRQLDLTRTRYTRVKGYRGDNIRKYDEESNVNRVRSNRSTPRSNKSTGRRSG